ncbi:pro-resilin-like [Amphibalanus amphitrite]|uniref:pro-resilin-like n=1 Tax=Amphibalanus amphitrite TaxID=1232801 RepID=UPI001C929A47|nr:pro-resilin-like [Amphibalanus amphitrite]
MLRYQSVGVLLLAALVAPAPAPDGASYGAPPPLGGGRPAGGFGGASGGFGGASGGFGGASGGFGGAAGGYDGAAAGFSGATAGFGGATPAAAFGAGAAGAPLRGFGASLGGGASGGRRGALREPVGPGLRPDGLPIGPGMPYSFSWAVDEPDYGNQYGHEEESDGVVTQGQYRVLLPDGRTQIVTYSVEGDSGFQAQVTYEGEAQFPPAGQPALPAVPFVPARPAVPAVPADRLPSANGRVTRLGAGRTFPQRVAIQRGTPFPVGTAAGGARRYPEDDPATPSTSYGF